MNLLLRFGCICCLLINTNCNVDTTITETREDSFVWETEQFADIRILRYQVPSFDKLKLDQKKLVYFLSQAGLSGRDIIYDQNYEHNLAIRDVLEGIFQKYSGDKTTKDWRAFEVYIKRFWFSNGIHHHYSHTKIIPEFNRECLVKYAKSCQIAISDELLDVIFDPQIAPKKVSKAEGEDLLLASSVNFYDADIREDEATAFYAQKSSTDNPKKPLSHGLNSKLIRNEAGELEEKVWHLNGMYGPAIEKITYWLEKAVEVAENEKQAKALKLLIEYYKTGDLKTWDDYNVAWVAATEGDIDYINGFIEVYNDPLGYKANFESIVQINDFEATERMQVISENIQWFEDNSPIHDEYKKENVKGVSYKVVNVASESGDASPSTPIGVNLPNANWIRVEHGSKSVSLGNIESAYHKASGEGFLEEFTFTTEEFERAKMHGELASKMHTALHEVVGHASGKLKDGVKNAKEVLKNYYSTLEEARADLVSLYYITNPKLIDMGLVKDLEVGKAEYDSYIRNGLMLQLRRIEPGEHLEEDHMRNRQLVAAWAYEKGKAENVIEKKQIDGKTYFVIQDYDRLRDLFGELLREIQRIKSEGDYAAGKDLVEKYGVKVDGELHAEVLRRSENLKIPPYAGFINPTIRPEFEGDKIIDVRVYYPKEFSKQMIRYSEKYRFLK